MFAYYKKILNLLVVVLFPLLFSCNKQFKEDNFVAYFGGEVTNPTNPYVLFCKDSKVIDTIRLKNDHTFFVKFDSLTPGLYSFKHEPEFQYVYFDKNDSLMVAINTKDFDQSIVFSGRGDEKNNFLMELFLKNEDDKSKFFNVLDYNVPDFIKNIDAAYASKKRFYAKKQEEIKWSADFDIYARATLDFFQYSKKEIYPVMHQMRTGENIKNNLPENYYFYRNGIDFNNTKFTNYYPFVKYLNHMLNNVASDKDFKNTSDIDKALDININKLNIADTMFNNKNIKNTILNNIAFSYLLEDQNIINNKKFLDKYHQLSTDNSKQNEIIKIGNAIQLLKIGNQLPNVNLIDNNNNIFSSKSLVNKKAVLFFWTENLDSHMVAAHKKILKLIAKHPDYQFIAINVDGDQEQWKKQLANYKFDGIIELRADNFEDLKEKWVINKIHRTLILNADGTINNAFVSLFDVKFEENLK